MIGIPDDFTDEAMWAELIATHMEQKFMSPRAYRRVCAKVRSADSLEAELAQARETIARLNRRCQRAEGVADQNVEACRRAGVSLGRGLAGYAARKYADELEAERAGHAATLARLEALQAAIVVQSAHPAINEERLEPDAEYARRIGADCHEEGMALALSNIRRVALEAHAPCTRCERSQSQHVRTCHEFTLTERYMTGAEFLAAAPVLSEESAAAILAQREPEGEHG